MPAFRTEPEGTYYAIFIPNRKNRLRESKGFEPQKDFILTESSVREEKFCFFIVIKKRHMYNKDSSGQERRVFMGYWMEGRTLAKQIREKVGNEVSKFLKTQNQSPGLAGILVGENEASKIYLGIKEKHSRRLNIRSEIIHLSETTEASSLKEKIQELNQRDDVDGILIQLPLPSSFDTHDVLMTMNPEKDVDGFHPFSLGNLLMNEEGFRPCTPLGIMELLKSYNIPIEGQRVVVIGRSLIVGKPLAALMTNANGTVTLCHSRTKELNRVAAGADILVAAIGRGAYVTPDFVKEGAVVVDVGQNSLSDRDRVKEYFGDDEKREKDLEKKGYTLTGDVHPQVIQKARYLTPVPGGVGPLTVAMLMKNTLEAFKKRRGL